MEEYYYNRSRSYTCSNYNDHRPSRLPAANTNSVSNNYELRSYSSSASSNSYQVANYYYDQQPQQQQHKGKVKKGGSSSTTTRSWSVKDPELQRKKRVARYKMYSAQGRVKGSFRNSFRWLKDGYARVVYGWW